MTILRKSARQVTSGLQQITESSQETLDVRRRNRTHSRNTEEIVSILALAGIDDEAALFQSLLQRVIADRVGNPIRIQYHRAFRGRHQRRDAEFLQARAHGAGEARVLRMP